MALDPENVPEFSSRVTPADANYPYGSSQNESAPGNDDGTPYIAKRANDLWGLLQGLLTSAGITPSNSPDTALISQYLKAINEQASGRAQGYDESGVANAYVLDIKSDQQTPEKVFDGQELWFVPGNDQTTAACTLDPYAQGALAIKKPGGVTDPEIGSILAGVPCKVTYRALPSPHYELEQPFTFSNVISGPGYIIFPNGWAISQSSGSASTGAGTTINLPITFNGGYTAVGSWNSALAANTPLDPLAVHTLNASQIRLSVLNLGLVNTTNVICFGKIN